MSHTEQQLTAAPEKRKSGERGCIRLIEKVKNKIRRRSHPVFLLFAILLLVLLLAWLPAFFLVFPLRCCGFSTATVELLALQVAAY